MILSELVNRLVEIAFMYGDCDVYINTHDSAEFYENALINVIMPDGEDDTNTDAEVKDIIPIVRLEGFHNVQKSDYNILNKEEDEE